MPDIAAGFNLGAPVPVDTRLKKRTIEERDSIPLGVRYEGMEVYVEDVGIKYQLYGGITNDLWKPIISPGAGAGMRIGGCTWYVDTDKIVDKNGKTVGSLSDCMTADYAGTWFYAVTTSSEAGSAAYPSKYTIDGANGNISLRDYVVWTGDRLVHIPTFEAKASEVKNSDGKYSPKSGVDGLMSSTDKAYLTDLINEYWGKNKLLLFANPDPAEGWMCNRCTETGIYAGGLKKDCGGHPPVLNDNHTSWLLMVFNGMATDADSLNRNHRLQIAFDLVNSKIYMRRGWMSDNTWADWSEVGENAYKFLNIENIINELKNGLNQLAYIEKNHFEEGANRFNLDTTIQGFLSGSSIGSISGADGTYVTSDFIYVGNDIGRYITLSIVNSSNVIQKKECRILFYDLNKNPISDTFNVSTYNALIVDNAMYVRISYDKTSKDLKQFMLIVSDDKESVPLYYVEYSAPYDIAEINECAIPKNMRRANPYKLVLSGDVEAEYDGTKEVSVVIKANKVKTNEIIVGSSDGAAFKTIKDAVTSITDSSENNVYNIMIEDGVYEEKDIELPNYVNLIGISGICENVWIKGEQADSAVDSVITPSSTVNVRFSHVLKNITVTSKNMRYPVHCESGNANQDWCLIVENCHIEHYGNESAKQYREDNELTETTGYTSLWTSCHGWGEGASSGAYAKFKNCKFKSIEQAWYIHEGLEQEKPYVHEFENCEFISTAATPWSINIDNTRTTPLNQLTFNDCYFGGSIKLNIKYPIDIRINGFCPCIFSQWKNGGTEVQSYYSDKAYPTLTNYMKEVIYNGESDLLGGEALVYDVSAQSVVRANSASNTDLFAGIAIGTAKTGDKVRIQTGGFIYRTTQSVGKYYGFNDDGTLGVVSDKTKAIAVGCGGWWIQLLQGVCADGSVVANDYADNLYNETWKNNPVLTIEISEECAAIDVTEIDGAPFAFERLGGYAEIVTNTNQEGRLCILLNRTTGQSHNGLVCINATSSANAGSIQKGIFEVKKEFGMWHTEDVATISSSWLDLSSTKHEHWDSLGKFAGIDTITSFRLVPYSGVFNAGTVIKIYGKKSKEATT